MSFTPRPSLGTDDPTEDSMETVEGATEMVGAATFMIGPAEDHLGGLVGARVEVTTEPTEKVLVTELGGVTPTAKTRPAPEPGPRDPIFPAALTPHNGAATVVVTDRPDDPHDMPTRLALPGDDSNERVTSVGMPPLEPMRAHASPRGQTQNTVPRQNVDDTSPIVRGEDTQPRNRLDDTRRRPSVASAKKALGGYRVTGVLASGQMGVVYRGEHPAPRRGAVAIKSVQSELTSNPAAVARFFAESIVLARIDHPNVVRFHDFGYDAQGSAFLVMELLEGETLTSRLTRERRLDISAATDIALQISQGLAAAHKQGIIHRDVKPDNVFICNDGTVKLLDFGLAKLEGQGPTHTLAGDLLGTAAYMAPEQGRSASDSDARSDLYSVGCILFEMVCGVVPYPGSLVETLVAHQTAERPPARALNREVSNELDAIIDKLLQRDPAERPQTAVDVIKALGALESTTERPIRRKRVQLRGGARIPDGNRTLVGNPRWVAMRSRFDSIVERIVKEPIALGLLVAVIVLLVVLVVR